MSRVGKKPILIPEKVEAQVSGGLVLIKGKKGELKLTLPPGVGAEIKEKEILVSIDENKLGKKAGAQWGTYRQLIANMIEGVTNGFKKNLEINGVGYRAAVSGKDLVLAVGYSHEVKFPVPAGVSVTVDKNIITVEGIDKQLVGEIAAQIRRVKKPEPYKGKGIKYEGEQIKIKVGKKAKTATA